MVRLIHKEIAADTELTFENREVFSPSDIVRLLRQIEELKKCSVGLAPDENGALLLIVGNNEYMLTDESQMVFI